MKTLNMVWRCPRIARLTCSCPCRINNLDKRFVAPFKVPRTQEGSSRGLHCRPLAATQKVTQGRKRTQKKADKQEKDAAGGSKEAAFSATADRARADAERRKAVEEDLLGLVKEHGHEAVTDAVMEHLPETYSEEFPVMAGRRAGYTPFEYILFTEKQIDHDVTMQVNAPISKVYRIWANRINYNEWFDLIGQVVLHRDDPEFASYFFFYRWGKLPTLELYATLQRTLKENEYVLEQSVDGMGLVAGAYFSEKDGGTEVRLRVSYMLPEPLQQFVGPVGVWGDVNDILTENLEVMKVFVENVDLDALDEARAQDEELMDEGLRRSNETLDELKKQLDEEGVFPGEGSPQARAGMAEILREIGYSDEEIFESPKQEQTPGDVSDDAGAGVSGDDGDGSAADEQPTGRQRPVELAAAESTVQGAKSTGREPKAGPSGELVPPEDGDAAGWARRGRGWNKGVQKAPELTKEYLLANMDKTQTEIAKALGVSPSTISKACMKNGIEWPRHRKPKASESSASEA